MGTEWTKEEDRILREMFHAGTTINDVSDRLGRSYNSVKERASLLRKTEVLPFAQRGRRPDAYSEEEERLIVEMFNAGHTIRDIAHAVGRNSGSLTGKIRRMRESGVDIRRRYTGDRQNFLYGLRCKHGVRLGRVSEYLWGPDVSHDARIVEWFFERAVAGGYETVSEYFVDHMFDMYFKEHGDA